ncbi:butyrophilin subfamily 1 member A1-like [Brachyistius frenatus]|uniref:butyrophilin subfamily 1 member A1-like n=1 Tax=Brachyistius frenatus TaxID=100188 RepID=UPI0037E85F95
MQIGQNQVIVPSQPIVAILGDDVMLPSRVEPAVDAAGMTVEWTRPALTPRFVYVWRDGVELESKKHPSFKTRTSLSIDKLKLGDISLKLSNVTLNDGGSYTCFVPSLNGKSSVELIVGAASSPDIIIAGLDESSRGVMLDCKSAGWYPEPEVLWLDAEGNLLSAGPTESVRGPDDLYTVSSRVTVEKRHSNSFTCRVQQNNINQTREVHIHLRDDFFNTTCSPAASLTAISLAVVIVQFLVGYKT